MWDSESARTAAGIGEFGAASDPELLAGLKELSASTCQPGYSDFSDSYITCVRKDFFGKMNSEQGEVPCLKGSELPFASRVLPEGCLQGQATGLCA